MHDLNGGDGVKTLFATHYHELTELARTHARVKNLNIAVKEWNDEIIFLRKLVQGGTNRSYGIQVARLAGIPPPVIDRAKRILYKIEQEDYYAGGTPGPTSGTRLEEFKAAFDKRYGKDAKRTVYGWYAYDATWIAALALGLAGTDNPDQIVKSLHIVSKYYNGVTGDKTFDKDGMQKMDYFQKFVFKDGKLVPYGW